MRAVLDRNVLISALLAPAGASAALLRRWLDGKFELAVSEQLAELRRALTYPKLRSHVTGEEAKTFIELLRGTAMMAHDAASPARLSRDPGDDYLLALASSNSAILVSVDQDSDRGQGRPGRVTSILHVEADSPVRKAG